MELAALTERVIGAAIEVHRELGPGTWRRCTKKRYALSWKWWGFVGRGRFRCN
jgi:hypothetical protein